MKFLLFLAVAGAIFAGAFYNETDFREKIRVWQMDEQEKQNYEIYGRAKSVLQAEWDDAPKAEFPAWGDGPGERVMPINGKVYLVSGHVILSSGSAKARKPWCALIGRGDVKMTLWFVGERAVEVVKEAEDGELKAKLDKTAGSAAPAPGRGAGAATPAPSGAWMWEKRSNPLDDKPKQQHH